EADPLGSMTSYGLDPNGNRTRISPPRGAGGASAPAATTFGYTGAAQTYLVPAGVTQVLVDAQGGQGGNGGGQGGRALATISVSPGQQLQVNVGGAGTCCSQSTTTFGGGGAGGRNSIDGSYSSAGG